ncbi:mosc domain protein [Achlya hypogyna]|uniref:Mosc domain protein n=1 Tax=Achlya hypogyna TaxID=1202772 RepID=A0A1V9YK34_ACHHY|nr:mosc domain protein [Achlya hypogyna]
MVRVALAVLMTALCTALGQAERVAAAASAGDAIVTREEHTRLLLSALNENPITAILLGRPLGLLTQVLSVEQAVGVLCFITLVASVVVPKIMLRLLTPSISEPKTLVPTIRAAALDTEAKRPNAYPVNCPVVTARHGTATVVAYDAAKEVYAVQTNDEQRVEVGSADVLVATVQDLFVYPIKSCKGLRLTSSAVLPQGLACDRQWIITDAEGNFITQRKYPRMALIAPQVDVTRPDELTLSGPGMPDLVVPVTRTGPELRVRVFKDFMQGIDQGAAAAEWVSSYLQLPNLRLVRFKDGFHRPCEEEFAPGHGTGFADGYPILIACQASIDAMAAAAQQPVRMNRFRPNIVMTGTPPFADDVWGHFEVGGLRFQNVKPCSRCNMPSVNQEKGERDDAGAALQTALLASRNGQQLSFLDKRAKNVFFGSNVVTLQKGTIRVGDSLKVLTLL